MSGHRKRAASLEERFQIILANYWPDDNGCWNWRGATNQYGYPHAMTRQDGKNKLARPHRLSYERHRGPIPAGMMVCHTCDNRRCINPAHLFVGTALDNNRDAIAKGRHVTQRHPKPIPVPPPTTPPMLEGDKLAIWLARRKA